MRQGSLWVWVFLAFFLTVAPVCIWKSGRWLVADDHFQKVRWAVVLAGESRDCERTDAAIRLFQDGRIDSLVISGCRIFKTRYQSEFLADYAAHEGVPRGRLFEFRQDAYSTLEEARVLVRQFRLQNLDTVLIITSNYHTARTRRIFRKLTQGYPVVLVYPAEYHVYEPGAWWSNRESLKYWFNEWGKTLFTVFELARTSPENGKADFQGLTPDIWSGPMEKDSGHPNPSSPSGMGSSSMESAHPQRVISTAESLAVVHPDTLAKRSPTAKVPDSGMPSDDLRAEDSTGTQEKKESSLHKEEIKSAANGKDPMDESLKSNAKTEVNDTSKKPVPKLKHGQSKPESELKNSEHPANKAAKKPPEKAKKKTSA